MEGTVDDAIAAVDVIVPDTSNISSNRFSLASCTDSSILQLIVALLRDDDDVHV